MSASIDNSRALEILSALRDQFSDVSDDEFLDDDNLSDYQDHLMDDDDDSDDETFFGVDENLIGQTQNQVKKVDDDDDLVKEVFDVSEFTLRKRTFSFQSAPSSPRDRPASPTLPQEEKLTVDYLKDILQEIDEDEYPLYDEAIDYGDYYDPRTNRKQFEVIKEKRRRRDIRAQLSAPAQPETLLPLTPRSGAGILNNSAMQSQKLQNAQEVSRHIQLIPLFDDISSRELQRTVGHPTAFKASGRYIAVGTALGLVLLYDRKEQRRLAVLGSRYQDEHRIPVSVTSMGFGGKIVTGDQTETVIAFSNFVSFFFIRPK